MNDVMSNFFTHTRIHLHNSSGAANLVFKDLGMTGIICQFISVIRGENHKVVSGPMDSSLNVLVLFVCI